MLLADGSIRNSLGDIASILISIDGYSTNCLVVAPVPSIGTSAGERSMFCSTITVSYTHLTLPTN